MIPPEAGTKFLLRLLRAKLPDVAVVASSRLGRPSTLRWEPQPLPHFRFLEQLRVFYPHVELIADAQLSAETDFYLKDHALHQEQLLPAVIGLEQMAQTAMALVGEQTPPTFERVEFSRPIVVGEGTPVVRAAALAVSRHLVDVALRSSDTGFSLDHFRASCSFESTRPAALLDEANPGATSLPLDPIADLYGKIMFQGPRFQCLRHYTKLTASECAAQIAPIEGGDWFARYLPSTFALGHPGVRDAAIHALQACIPHRRVLPVGVDRIVIHSTNAPSPYMLRARERVRDNNRFVFDMELRSADGKLFETWQGLHLKAVEALPYPDRWPEPLFGAYLERSLHEWSPGCGIQILFDCDGGAGSEDAIRKLTGSKAYILRRKDGKPGLPGISISASHCGSATLAMSGPNPVGCDMEAVEKRSLPVWQSLLGQHFSLVSLLMSEAHEDQDSVATLVWTVLEALKKAGAAEDTPLVFAAVGENGWVHCSAGSFSVASLIARLKSVSHRIVVSLAFAGLRERPRPSECVDASQDTVIR
jgi:enediyne polyketide synthase